MAPAGQVREPLVEPLVIGEQQHEAHVAVPGQHLRVFQHFFCQPAAAVGAADGDIDQAENRGRTAPCADDAMLETTWPTIWPASLARMRRWGIRLK
jgi:hypothetical protein